MFALTSLLSFLLSLWTGLAPLHPHNPKALIVHGAAGKATLTYFTVPFNPEHLKDLKPGFEWHLGYAALNTEVPLQSGDVQIPPANYKCGVVRGEAGNDWSLLLEPFDLWRARSAIARARGAEAGEKARADATALQEKLAAAGIPDRIVIPTDSREAADAEHLELAIVLAGFDTDQRFSVTPAGGMNLALQFDFGTLHRTIALHEAFDPKRGK